MYTQISWEMVADPLGSVDYTLGTNGLGHTQHRPTECPTDPTSNILKYDPMSFGSLCHFTRHISFC
jgi:hypothetical protein